MIKPILALVAISALLTGPAFSKTLKLPNDEFPIASITFPDDWEPDEINNGAAAQSPDTAVYLAAVAGGSEKGMAAEIDDTFEMLKAHDVTIDKASKKTSKFNLNGIEAEEMTFKGKDEDGPTTISIAFVPVDKKVVVITYWVTTAKEKQHQPEVAKILKSLRPNGAAATNTKSQASAVKIEGAIAVDSETKPATSFAADVPKLQAFFRSNGTKKGDKLRGLWIAEDVGEAAPANTKIDEATINADKADFFGAFSLSKPNKGWPVGKYRVEIYSSEELATTVKFAIAAAE